MLFTNNTPNLANFRKQLRNNPTPAESFLWQHLKNKQLLNQRFRRQFSIHHYILDFYCPSQKLAIELDGPPHISRAQADLERDTHLKSLNITVLRFINNHVLTHIHHVIQIIQSHIKR